MTRFVRPLAGAVLMVAFVAAPGCNSSTVTSGKKLTSESPALKYFKKEQRQTMTPHGKVLPDTAVDSGDKIEYQTDSGQKWRVGYSKRADGTYEFLTPEEAK